MDIFEAKSASPMLISKESPPFDSKDYIFELKLDGIRGIVYLDKTVCELRNKRNKNMNPIFPELAAINKYVNSKCILDGEYVALSSGRPDFFEIQRRSLMTNKFNIEQAGKKAPIVFVAYDILYYEGKEITHLPLLERKELLNKAVNETNELSISRFVHEKGINLFNLTKEQNLEGIVAKEKSSKYYMGKRTKDWIKIKNLQDDDFIILGYIPKENGVASLVLGKYKDEKLIYKGQVSMGLSNHDFKIIQKCGKSNPHFQDIPGCVWLEPLLVCSVKYMEKPPTGFMRQSVFKGLRLDKTPEECVEN